jgi:minor extracellular serine protease Vpr
MKVRILIAAAFGLGLSAQVIPNQYIIELQSDGAARVSADRHARYSSLDTEVIARKTAIAAEQAPVESAIAAAGGRVNAHYNTLINAMAITIPDASAPQLRALPNVRSVTQMRRVHKTLDVAVKSQRVTDTWSAIPGGLPNAGAGILIGIIDTGIDIAHPGFEGFTAPVPSGFPIACDYSVGLEGAIVSNCNSNPGELANTNNKVIVSRDYTGIGGGDNDGHGTGVSMIAAGLTNNAVFDVLLSDGVTVLPIPLDPITGVAPGAWLGAYKVLDPNNPYSGSIANVLLAVEDAVNDGVSVLNLSLGSESLNYDDETGGPVPHAVANAVAAGVVVVCAAGNDGSSQFGGQQPTTISLPAIAPEAIAVGAIGNGREFDYSVTVPGLPPVEALLFNVTADPDDPDLIDPVQGPLFDVTQIDPTGLACNALPAGSLNSQIALIFRGTCTFDTKLNNAMNAGAIAAVVADNRPESLVFLDLGLSSAAIPALFIAQSDGVNIQAAADSGGATAYLDFGSITPFPANPQTLAYYTSAGPTENGNIKPDMMAIGGQPLNWTNYNSMLADYGSFFYTGAQVLTAFSTVVAAEEGLMDPYTVGSGTSFATPFVTGSIAVLMSARPGLTAEQYKSLVVNSAPQLVVCGDYSPPTGGVCYNRNAPAPPIIQNAGSGSLDLFGAYQNNLTAQPLSINFGTASGSVANTIPVTLTNAGSAPDSFTVAVNPLDGMLAPTVDTPAFSLTPGQTQVINLTMAAQNLAPGTFNDGNVTITGTQTPIITNIAYWFGVPGAAPAEVVILNQQTISQGGGPIAAIPILLRYTDAIGMPVKGSAPTVTLGTGTSGRVLAIGPGGDIPGTWEIEVRLDDGLGSGCGIEGYDEFDINLPANLPSPLQICIPVNN